MCHLLAQRASHDPRWPVQSQCGECLASLQRSSRLKRSRSSKHPLFPSGGHLAERCTSQAIWHAAAVICVDGGGQCEVHRTLRADHSRAMPSGPDVEVHRRGGQLVISAGITLFGMPPSISPVALVDHRQQVSAHTHILLSQRHTPFFVNASLRTCAYPAWSP